MAVGSSARAQDKVINPLSALDAEDTQGSADSPSPSRSLADIGFAGLSSPILVDPLFGSATAQIRIDVPPGRLGLTPDLTIQYSSNGGNGPFGLGWALPLGWVRRSTARGVPVDHATGQYVDAGFDLSFGGKRIALDRCIDVACNYWAASAEETWLDVSFDRSGNRWQVRDRNGVTYTYGAVPEARVGNDVAAAASTYGWSLTELRDPNGNTIAVQYRNPIGAGPNSYAYPLQVDYGGNPAAGIPHVFHIAFDYDDTRPDVVPSYRGGFAEEVAARVSSIAVSVDTEPRNPTRAYGFHYDQDPDTGISLLRRVDLVVADEASPPDTTFSYTGAAHGLEPPVPLAFSGSGTPLSALASVQTDAACVSCSPIQVAVRSGFADVDGDGRKDYVNGTDGPGLPVFRNVPSTTPDIPSFQSSGTLTTQATTLADDTHLLIDITGDGRPDYVTANTAGCLTPGSAATCSWDVAVNVNGSLGPPISWPGVPADLRGLIPRPLPWSGTQPAQLIDLDGDLLPDIIDCAGWSAAAPSCGFYRNNGSGFGARAPWSVPNAFSAHTPSMQSYAKSPLAAYRNLSQYYLAVTKRLIDLNGDGLPDLVSSESFSGSGYWDVWFNTGSGFGTAAFAWPAPSPSYIEFDVGVLTQQGSTEHWSWVTTAALRDMNGDGRLDYVTGAGSLEIPVHQVAPAIDRGSGPWMVSLNAGMAFTAGQAWSNTVGATLADNWYGWNFTPGWSDDNNATFDINADGIADNVLRTRGGGAPFSAALGTGPRPQLLERIENGLGASWSVTYAAYADDTSTVPIPLWTVATQEARSGLSGPGTDLTTTFAFNGARFEPATREFLGFTWAAETRLADGRRIERSFASVPGTAPPGIPTRPLKLAGQRLYDESGALLQETRIDWAAVPLGSGRLQVHPSQQVDADFGSGGSPAKTRTLSFDSYDPFNSLLQETVSGDDVAPITVTREYVAQTCSGLGCLQLLCPGLPTRTTVASGSRALSDQTLRYDGCNLAAIEARLAPPDQSASSGQVITQAAFEYDRASADQEQSRAARAGLPTRVVDARGNATVFRYGCSNWLYPCQVTNALNQTTGATYDLRWGTPRSVTDVPNNTTSTAAYDGFGRLSAITLPLDPLPARQLTYTFGAVAGGSVTPGRVEEMIREPNAAGGYRTSVRFYDAWGRHLGTKQRQYVDGSPSTVMLDTVAFDSVGRIGAAYTPFAASSADPNEFESPRKGAATTYAYDSLDRLIRVTNPDRTFRTFDYGIAGQTTVADENFTRGQYPGRKTTDVRDVLGRLLRTDVYLKDPGKAEALVAQTVNVVDALGRVTAKTLSDLATGMSATTTFRYDSFGRQVEATDPDSGTWRSAYDAAGNLVFQDDPQSGQHIELCYDPLNRVSRKVYVPADAQSNGTVYCAPTTLAPPLSYVQLQYDSACGANGVGRLCGVDEYQRSSGANATVQTSFTYDARGRVQTQSQTVTLASYNQTSRYTQTYGHDEADRLVTVTYPTNTSGGAEIFSYQYDDLGQLALVRTPAQVYATGLSYDLFGRLTLWQDGSGLLHQALYDTTGKRNFRLLKLKVSAPQNGSTVSKPSLRLEYARYDGVGNIVKIKDRTPYSARSLRNDWTYQYDGMGRLRAAKKIGAASMSFGYDQLGNMLAGNGLSFEYAGPGAPHRATALTGAGNLSYDGNGALAIVPATGTTAQRAMDYDADGRLQEVTTSPGALGEHTVRTLYDFRGGLVARIVDESASPVITFSFGRWFDTAGPGVTRHIYLGGQLIAESPATGSGPKFPVHFILSDHLGSTVALSCYLQGATCPDRTIHQFFRYRPYGQVDAYDASGAPVSAGNALTDILYTGKRWDWRSQLYDFGARFYDPALARFLTLDPILDHPNPYAYVSWNPINRVDASGLFDVAFSWEPGGGDPYVESWHNRYDPWSGEYDPYNGYGPWVAGYDPSVQPAQGPLYSATFGGVGFEDVPAWFPTGIPEGYVPTGTEYDLFVTGAVGHPVLQPFDLLVTAGVTAATRAGGATLVGAVSSRPINRSIPEFLARVVPGYLAPKTLGRAEDLDVFVTAAEDIAGLSAEQVAKRLGIPRRPYYKIIEFASSRVTGIASPINRSNPGFVGKGLTSGGAREFVIPNGPLPPNSIIRIVE